MRMDSLNLHHVKGIKVSMPRELGLNNVLVVTIQVTMENDDLFEIETFGDGFIDIQTDVYSELR